MVVGVTALCLPARTRKAITTRTASPAMPQAMTGIPPPSGGLLANMASLLGAAGVATGGFGEELAEVSGGFGSLISRNSIPPNCALPPFRRPDGKESSRATLGKLCRFFIEEPELYDARSR